MAQFPLIDQASLVMIPGAYKEGKIYSQLPTDGSGDFTYTRGTDTATRVNEAGNIEKEYENTLLQSNNWAQSDSQYEITGGEAGYDGTNDAWLVNKLAAAYFSKDALVLTGVQTISFYAKAGSLDRIFVFIGGDAARFDLTNGTAVSAGGNPVSQNIELVSGTTDWYRCSIVLNKTSTQNLLIKPQNSSNQDVTGTIYIQDAQLNQGLVAYPYLETTTVPVYAGLTDNMPRLDYSGGASCPALLLEPQRTNLIEQSEYFETYNKTRVAFIHNATASPEGLVNAAEFNDTATSGTHFVQLRTGVVGGGVMSFFAKQNTHRYVQAGPSSSISKRVFFDLQDGVMATIGGSAESYYGIEDYGNGWYRCYVAFGDLENPSIFTATGDGSSFNDNNYTGDGSGVYIYGAQVEQSASYETSYIPTYGSAVSRANDLFELRNVQTNGLVTSTQGTMFFHITDIAGTAVVYNIQTLNDLSYALRFVVRDNGYVIYQRVNNVQTIIRARNDLTLSEWKIAMSWNGTNLITSLNGTSYIDTVDASIASQLDKIARVNPQAISVTTNQILVFPTQLTEADLNTLTTL